ncbi:hypothetical protein L873DRAFT_777062 [Choiromyces venosus 120613-1]|uniref:Uncharacterized protein n=1 Tax=Choiromyces venosus 120613-1 TaxID=1336337 RepID=A0A3N4K3Q4_9PEZI|nr:hypothetical protein L873DRAFT_777062 [Choiromyces venosus 120613-1]
MDPPLPPIFSPSIDGGSNSPRGDGFIRHSVAGGFDPIGQNFTFAPAPRREAPTSFTPNQTERGVKSFKLNSSFVPSSPGSTYPGFINDSRKRPIETKESGFPLHKTSRLTKREKLTPRSDSSSTKSAVIVLDDDDGEAEEKGFALAPSPENGPSRSHGIYIRNSESQREKGLRHREDDPRVKKRLSGLPSASSDSSIQSLQASGRAIPSHYRNSRTQHDHLQVSVTGNDSLKPVSLAPSRHALDWNQSQRDLLIAMNSLSAEKESVEKKLLSKESDLKSEHILVEAEREKVAQLEGKLANNNKKISNIKEKTDGLQKFFNGMGSDYKVLQEKYSKLSALFSEVCKEREGLKSDREEIRLVVQKLEKTNSKLSESISDTKEKLLKFEKLNEANVYLQQQLSENAGLLAAERDRVQTLELQAREDVNYFRREIEQKQLLSDITRENLKEFEKQLSEVDNIGRAIGAIKESNSKIGEDLVQKLSTKCAQLENNLSIRVHDIKIVVENAVSKGLEYSEERLDQLASTFEKFDVRSDYLKMVNDCKKLFDDILKIYTQSRQISSDSANFKKEFVEHLNSQIQQLEGQLKEMRECRSHDLVKLTEKEAELNALKHELGEKKREGLLCDRLDSLLQSRNAILSEKISSLSSNIQNKPGDSSLITALKQEVSELNGKLEQVTRSFNDHLSEKVREINQLDSQVKSLDFLYGEARQTAAHFDKEKTEYLALIEGQRLQERIDLENTANSLRLSETSGLNNRIKSLEVQKEKLEIANALLEESLLAQASKNSVRLVDSLSCSKIFTGDILTIKL